jgi:hypothetical protein
MTGFASRLLLLAGGALWLVAPAAAEAPDLLSGLGAWTHPFGGEFPAVQGSATPMRNDPAHPHVPNGRGIQPTYRIGDLSNPNLKQWANQAAGDARLPALARSVPPAPDADESCHG